MYVIEDTSNEAPEQEELAQDDLARELRTVVALRTKGRCRDGHGTLTHLFFSEDLYDIARAKAICAKCPVVRAVPGTRPRPPGAMGRLGWPAPARTGASSPTSGLGADHRSSRGRSWSWTRCPCPPYLRAARG